MRKLVWLIALVLFASCTTGEEVGVAHIQDFEGTSVVGHVYFVTLNSTTVWVWANITFLNTSDHSTTHAMHVHTFGDINSPTGANTGSHFIGSGIDVHHCEDNASRHEGDMGNWDVQDGGITQGKYLDLLALSGNNSIIGRGVILHEKMDDCMNAANSGARIAQGVIGIANLTNLPEEVAAMVQTNSTNTACSGGTTAGQPVTTAVVVLSPLAGSNITGLVTFEQNGDGSVTVKAVVHGLSPSSAYGFHIHQFGDLHSENGIAAGPHYNPYAAPHGLPGSSSRHVGDMGNICTYDEDGHTAYYQYTFSDIVTLSGLNNVIGRMVIIHSKFDNGGSRTDFGSRIAQGVIGIGNNFTSITFPENITFNSPTCDAFDPYPPLEIGVAQIVGAVDTNVAGSVYFVTVNSSYVWVWANISGISYNQEDLHGLHVHTFGDITSAAAANVKGHYLGVDGVDIHACEYTSPRHEGDMGNWQAVNGSILASKTLDLLALTGGFSIIGRGIILHNETDDCATTSSSGARLAQGVIGIANPAFLPDDVTIFVNSLTTTPANTACSGATDVAHAIAVLAPISGSDVSGLVVFHQEGNLTTVTAKVTGLSSSNAYGFHIHIFGDMSSQDGNAASSHYNPHNDPHGLAPNTPRHVGDLGNICTFGPDGTAYYNYTFENLVSLDGRFDIIGRAIIIHAKRDDGVSTDFGTRIAQGVIGIANDTDLAIPSDLDFSNSPVCAPNMEITNIGVAHLVGDAFDPTVNGFVYFVTLNSTHTWVWANISQITSNSDALHGLHIHALGDTNDKDKALFVGGHYIGASGEDIHACENTTDRHEGDMGNWQANQGSIVQSKIIDLVALSGDFSVIGRSVVLHDLTDNCLFVNSSGNRLAQGVIGIANPDFLPQQVRAIANITQNTATSGEAPAKAIAVIAPISGSYVRGVVTLEQSGSSVTVKARITGLSDPTHAYGFHIHTFGDMISGDGKSASSHYNPFNVPHNVPPSLERQVGDLGNICIFQDGIAYYSFTFTNLLTLSGNTSVIGRSVIIHSIPDSGGSVFGIPIGQGIIGYGSTSTNVTFPFPITNYNPSCADYHITTGSSTGGPSPTTGSATTSAPSKKDHKGLSGGAKAGIAFMVLIVVGVALAVGLYYNRHKRLPFVNSRSSHYSSAIDYVAFEDKDVEL
eukprot:Phypoly_transcript_01149.p1 GENE.Phypoly_transcript_01149~~Phypoly_transcript_01149.p1  ORF type:complete len:1164 (-),score=154.84 Phypoly_transcript_01149:17-3508(-)